MNLMQNNTYCDFVVGLTGRFFSITRTWSCLLILSLSLSSAMYVDASAESLWQSRELLMNSKFDELEARIIKSDKALAESKDGAVLYYDFVYRSMINTNDLIDSSTLLSQLHKWREARPKSYAPLAA
jgi:hypothetical protein